MEEQGEVIYQIRDKDGNIIKSFYKQKGLKRPKGIASLNKELILEMEKAGVLRKDIAKHFNVSVTTIRKAVGKKI